MVNEKLKEVTQYLRDMAGVKKSITPEESLKLAQILSLELEKLKQPKLPSLQVEEPIDKAAPFFKEEQILPINKPSQNPGSALPRTPVDFESRGSPPLISQSQPKSYKKEGVLGWFSSQEWYIRGGVVAIIVYIIYYLWTNYGG